MGVIARAFEFRASLANPDSFLERWFGGGSETYTGKHVTESSALSYLPLYCAVLVLSESVGQLPFGVFRKDGDSREAATDHPLWPVLHDAPNPEMSAIDFRSLMMGHLCTWGNAYAEKVYDRGGRIRELWPLRPDRMSVTRGGKALAYEYLTDGGAQKVYRAQDVFHVRGFGFDGVMGYSPVSVARQAIGLGQATEEFGGRFFGNGAAPSGALKHPGALGQKAYDNIKKSFEERHAGLMNARRPLILEEGMEWTQIGIPPDDAQFLETRKFQVSEIARLYRVPPHMLMDLDRATFSNIESQGLEFVTYTLLPWLVRWEQAVKRSLVSKNEPDVIVKFNVNAFLRGDAAGRAAFYAAGRSGGWLNPDEIRALEDINPIPGGAGKVYLQPLNMVPLGTEPPAPTPAPAPADEPDENSRAYRETRSAARVRQRVAGSYQGVMAAALERVIRREVAGIRKEGLKVLGQRDMAQFDSWLDEYYSADGLRDLMRREMRPVLSSIVTTLLPTIEDETGSEIGPEDVEGFSEDYLAGLIARHFGISAGQIRKSIQKAAEDGTSPEDALTERLDRWTENRPQSDAQRETVRFSNAAAKAAFILLGFTVFRWNAFGKSCPYCSSLDGVRVGAGVNFVNAGSQIGPEGVPPMKIDSNIGHPPAHGGCDCAISVG